MLKYFDLMEVLLCEKCLNLKIQIISLEILLKENSMCSVFPAYNILILNVFPVVHSL